MARGRGRGNGERGGKVFGRGRWKIYGMVGVVCCKRQSPIVLRLAADLHSSTPFWAPTAITLCNKVKLATPDLMHNLTTF